MGCKYIGANIFGLAMLYDQSEYGGGGVGNDAILSRKSHVNNNNNDLNNNIQLLHQNILKIIRLGTKVVNKSFWKVIINSFDIKFFSQKLLKLLKNVLNNTRLAAPKALTHHM